MRADFRFCLPKLSVYLHLQDCAYLGAVVASPIVTFFLFWASITSEVTATEIEAVERVIKLRAMEMRAVLMFAWNHEAKGLTTANQWRVSACHAEICVGD